MNLSQKFHRKTLLFIATISFFLNLNAQNEQNLKSAGLANFLNIAGGASLIYWGAELRKDEQFLAIVTGYTLTSNLGYLYLGADSLLTHQIAKKFLYTLGTVLISTAGFGAYIVGIGIYAATYIYLIIDDINKVGEFVDKQRNVQSASIRTGFQYDPINSAPMLTFTYSF
ncbi:MAG: hypothetical protein KDD94_09650 [Calditrichaeota bacterium]|nr:hypothetical protein [Calditrichota bacterium]